MKKPVLHELHGPHKKSLIRRFKPQIVELDNSTFVLLDDAGGVVGILSERDLLSMPQLLSRIRTRVVEEMQGNGRTDERAQQTAARYASLTAREREVMNLLVAAKQSKQIARQLGIAHKTAEHHRSNILRKMQVESTGELIRLALQGEA